MVQQNHDDIDNIWKIIKQVKKSFLISNDNHLQCQTAFHLVLEDEIRANNDNVEKYLTTNSADYNSHEYIGEDILQTAAEMFTYLNFCPSKKLILFYKELLLKRSTKDILLAITNVIKTRRNAEKVTAEKLLSKIDKKLKNLKYNIIDSLTQMKPSFVNCTDKSCSEEMKSLGDTYMWLNSFYIDYRFYGDTEAHKPPYSSG